MTVTAVIAAALLTVSGCASQRGAGDDAETPASTVPVSTQSPTPTIAPSGIASCAGGALTFSSTGGDLVGGAFHVNVYISNNTSASCELGDSSIAMSYHDSSAGKISEPLSLGSRFIVIGAGDTRSAAFDLPESCPAGAAAASSSPGGGDLTIRYRGKDTELSINVPDGIPSCGAPTFAINELDPSPNPSDLVTASIRDVSYKAGSGELTYTVTLMNRGNSPFSFGSTCPNYTEQANFGTLSSERYELSCSSERTLKPGDTAAFAMKMKVPPNYSGTYRLSWTLDTGIIAIHQGSA